MNISYLILGFIELHQLISTSVQSTALAFLRHLYSAVIAFVRQA